MSDEAALLAAIFANPDEDTPRLVYADWLDEHGQPERAEFIRVQVELARIEPWTERAVDLSIRELELERDHRDKWVAELPLFAKLRSRETKFRRGFPYSLTCTAIQYLKNAPQLARESAIQDWCLSGIDNQAAERLARSKYLSRIRGLWAGSASSVRTVLASPHMTDLREFTLREVFPDDAQLGDLFEIPAVRGVQRLQIVDAAFGAVANTPFTRLKTLAIGFPAFPGFPDAQGLAFAAAPWLNQLAELDVGTLTDQIVNSVQGLPALPALKVFRCDVGNVRSGMARLLEARILHGIVEFSIIAMKDSTAKALLAAPFLEQIRVLNLVEPGKYRGCTELLCSVASFSRLIESGRLSQVLKLRVRDSGSNADAIARAIVESRGLTSLRHLADVSSDTSPSMLTALTTTPNLPNLRMVTLYPWGKPISVPRH